MHYALRYTRKNRTRQDAAEFDNRSLAQHSQSSTIVCSSNLGCVYGAGDVCFPFHGICIFEPIVVVLLSLIHI